MQELRPHHMRRDLAHLEIECDELPRILDDLASRHDNRRDILQGRQLRLLEELDRKPLHGTATAGATSIAPSRAGHLPRLHGLRPLVDRTQNLTRAIEKHGLERRRPNVYA